MIQYEESYTDKLPFALNNYTIGPMTTNRKVMYNFSIIKYWEAFADEK